MFFEIGKLCIELGSVAGCHLLLTSFKKNKLTIMKNIAILVACHFGIASILSSVLGLIARILICSGFVI